MIKHRISSSFFKSNYDTINDIRRNHISVPHPKMINLSMKTICNLKCKMCYNWKRPKRLPVKISKEKWLSTITDLRKEFPNKDIILAFTGSESLLYPDIYDLIKHARDIKFDVWLHSNGSLINNKIAQKLKECNLENITLSLDSIIPKEHNTMRGSNKSYRQVLGAIDVLWNNNIKTININTVLCSYNIRNINKLLIWAENNHKINSITLQAIVQPFNSGPLLRTWYTHKQFSQLWPKDKDMVQMALDAIIDEKSKYSKLINTTHQLLICKKYFRNPLVFVNHYGCNVKSKHLNIDPKGKVAICPLDNSGDIKKNSINQIWHSNLHQDIYNNMNKCTRNCHLVVNCAYEKEEA